MPGYQLSEIIGRYVFNVNITCISTRIHILLFPWSKTKGLHYNVS